jgi:hypothetical protein
MAHNSNYGLTGLTVKASSNKKDPKKIFNDVDDAAARKVMNAIDNFKGADKYKGGKARNKKKMIDAIGGYAKASKDIK